jgi:hypothetical protein
LALLERAAGLQRLEVLFNGLATRRRVLLENAHEVERELDERLLLKCLKKRRLLREDDDPREPAAPSTTEALTLPGMQRGTLVTVRDGANDVNDEDAGAALPPPPPAKTDAVVFERFNLHASVALAADDDTGRERLCRYLTRPAFALARIRLLRDGNVAYRVRRSLAIARPSA